MIDIPLLLSTHFNNENSEIFFILLSFVEKVKEMTINLADRSLKQFFFIINYILLNNINSIHIIYDIININSFINIITK